MTNNFTKHCFLWASILLLNACTPVKPIPETRLYLLSSDHTSTALLNDEDTRYVVGIAPITVADYIASDGLALINAQQQVHIAKYHKWAEKPEHAVARVLQADLSQLLEQVRIDNAQDGNTTDWNYRIRLHIDQMHGSDNGLAVLSGFWRIEHLNESRSAITSKRFNLHQPLTSGGYAGLVAALRNLSKQLAKEIAGQLPKLS